LGLPPPRVVAAWDCPHAALLHHCHAHLPATAHRHRTASSAAPPFHALRVPALPAFCRACLHTRAITLRTYRARHTRFTLQFLFCCTAFRFPFCVLHPQNHAARASACYLL